MIAIHLEIHWMFIQQQLTVSRTSPCKLPLIGLSNKDSEANGETPPNTDHTAPICKPLPIPNQHLEIEVNHHTYR